ncbi:TPA: hypothetical protein ACGJWA_005485 [Pseudomonas aeruginosa]|uniref:hypothetical protein n=1 Tax=Pseudomonas aeruginosa TaxID=287 RepID=UPI00053E380C|nr:hypothetical protein [Pseudomonas aeruginosa]HBO1242292.1 hypothetical protein [Pseudomonas aeruginosa]HBO1881058.1 hypothetical protein [Pseudomonas aeruginosa]HBO2082075.1 hypothetical protein [Pseudomonas aeruginosa]
MKMLSKAVSSRLENFVAPKRGEGFEDLCLDIFEHVLRKGGVSVVEGTHQRILAHGVSGDSQNGVDIYDPATFAAAQCKNQANLNVSDLEKEMKKLEGFERPVSHYFFMLGREGVPKVLQAWVDKANKRRIEDARSRDLGAVSEGSVAGPMLHIMGWHELRAHLFESNFLMWKWGVAHPVIHQYPYLPTLDVAFLAETGEALSKKVNLLPNRRDSRDAVEGLLRSVDVEGLANLVADAEVEREVFAGLEAFIQEFRHAAAISRTYQAAVRDVDCWDPIIMEQGFAMMNDLARYLPRISVLRYLLKVYKACKELLDVFRDEDSFAWAQVVVEYQGMEIEEDGDTTMLFNFEHQDWSSPYFVDPEHVGGLVKDIVEGVRSARQEASGG